ncbi:GH15401 [Drosophila grimshawi]|uniref:GH15401 n=2 Tax=Drosophila grimshawi TaxID=7222 RepID=B4J333_DROGR|nr:GH15401 [Drosophila grimshawi]
MHARCMSTTGLSEELMNEAHKGKLPSDQTFKCFLHCMFDMFGLVDHNNDMHLDSLLEVLPPEIHPNIKKLADACDMKKGADGCDTVYQAVLCYLETDGAFIADAMNDLLG